MRLVILHPLYFNKHHLNRLKKLGKVIKYNSYPSNREAIIKRIKNADIVITSSVDIGKDILLHCKFLKIISLACSGTNRIDLDTCNKLGITVTNVPDYATDAVAEHTFALLLALMKRVKENDQLVRKGKFRERDMLLSQLKGKIFGIIGTGRIGSRVAQIANAFGCKVIANTLHPSLERAKKLKLVYVNFEKLIRESEIISLHIPLNESTVNMISYKEFNLMRKRPILINTSRGKIINHNALINALSKGLIAGAGLDVFYDEPLPKDDPLLKFSNVILSPHNAFYTPEALERCADTVVNNIETFIKGIPKNLVSNYK